MEMEQLYKAYKLASGVCTDSRKIEPGVIFFALKGPNFNGNNYAQQALEKGASTVVIDEPVLPAGKHVVLVSDVLTSLQDLASYHRKQFNIPVIGITGSNGKTTTKELMYYALKPKYEVLYTKGNLNNHIGVPLTLLNLTKSHEIAIIEMGANKKGDIKELCEIANPNFGIITNIGKAHLEGFGGVDGVIETKTELYQYISKVNGTIFYDASNEILKNNLPPSCKSISYAPSGIANFKYKALTENLPFASIKITSNTIKSNLIGTYNNTNIATAACIANYFEVPSADIKDAIEAYQPDNNRSEFEESGSNHIIWDAYNANPSSVELALHSLYQFKSNRKKIAILGDMNELGTFSEQEHQRMLKIALELHIHPILVGKHYKTLGYKYHLDTAEDLIEHLQSHPVSEALILIKGSRSIQLEKLKEIFK